MNITVPHHYKMLAISPQFSTLGWLLEDPISHHHQQNSTNYLINTEKLTETTSDSIDQYLHIDSPSHGIQSKNSESIPSFYHEGGNDDRPNKMSKKLNHNASERDRRKRINTLYSTLRSLLPQEDQDQCRKLSIPATISRVVKYIPELQREVEGLIQKKENLMLEISKQEEEDLSMGFRTQVQRKKAVQSSSSAISATQISNQEMVIQISMPKVGKGSFCGALTHLEMESFVVLSASCFESFGGRVFCCLHLQAQGSQAKDAEMLKQKILANFEEGERIVLN